MILAGRLIHRVALQSRSVTPHTLGSPEFEWTTYVTRWARITPKTSTEDEVGRGTEATATHQIELRYLGGVSSKDRVLYGDRVFEISGVNNSEELDEPLILDCVEILEVE